MTWRIVYKLILCTSLFLLFVLANKFIEHAFPLREPTYQTLGINQSALYHDADYDAYDLFHKQLTILVTVGGLLVAVFGLGIPFALYILQKRSLKEEHERMKEKINEILKKLTDDVNDALAEIDKKQNETLNILGEKEKIKIFADVICFEGLTIALFDNHKVEAWDYFIHSLANRIILLKDWEGQNKNKMYDFYTFFHHNFENIPPAVLDNKNMLEKSINTLSDIIKNGNVPENIKLQFLKWQEMLLSSYLKKHTTPTNHGAIQ